MPRPGSRDLYEQKKKSGLIPAGLQDIKKFGKECIRHFVIEVYLPPNREAAINGF
jgi:hypothetical protein